LVGRTLPLGTVGNGLTDHLTLMSWRIFGTFPHYTSNRQHCTTYHRTPPWRP